MITFHKQLSSPAGFNAGEERFVETWLVELSDPETKLSVIQQHQDYPIRFEQHPDYPAYYCIDANLDQPITSPNIRPLSVTWSTTIPKAFLVNGKPKYDSDPTKRPVDIHWGTYSAPKTFQMAYAKDRRTKRQIYFGYKPGGPLPEAPSVPIKTTADESIFVQENQEYRLLRFEKHVKQVPEFMAKAGLFLNSDTVKIQGIKFAPLELMAGGLDISPVKFANGGPYYTFTWYFLVAADEDGWVVKRRNAGFQERVKVVVGRDGKEYPSYGAAVLATGGAEEKYTIRPILVGPAYRQQFPSAPVLLTPDGRAYRAKGPNDKTNNFETNTGEILTTESTATSGLTDQHWKDAELKFQIRPAIEFKKYFPLR